MSVELGITGKAIWTAFNAAQLDAGTRGLVRELARCADNLDRLNDLVTGRQESWAIVMLDDVGEVQLSIDKILDEQRKTQTVFKTIYAELRQAGIKAAAGSLPVATDEGPKDMLAALRKQKEDRERQSG